MRFLKKQMNTGYFENLIREYLLDNEHGVIVTIETGARDVQRVWTRNLHDKLQAYKAGLSKEEIAESSRAYEGIGNISVRSHPMRKTLATIPVSEARGIFQQRDRTDL